MLFIATGEINKNAKYTKPLGCHALSTWRLCHIKPVGFNTNASIEKLDMSEIKEHKKLAI